MPLRSLDFLGFPNYRIYKTGAVWSIKNNMWLTPWFNSDNYYQVDLRNLGIRKSARVHRLVALAFIPNPYNKPTVNHIDGVKTNNNDWNLEWCTDRENIHHAINLGLTNTSLLPREIVCSICEKLSLGISAVDISNALGVSRDIIYAIKSGKNYSDISSGYTFVKGGRQLSEDVVRSICEYLSAGNTIAETSRILKLPYSTVSNIASRRSYKEIVNDYLF